MQTIKYVYEPPTAALANLDEAKRTYEEVKIAGGYNPATNAFTPLKLDDKDINFGGEERPLVDACDLFETIAAAMEAGIVDSDMWPTQLFANAESFGCFLEALEDYEQYFKLRDPWWSGLRALAGGQGVEEGFCNASDLAARLLEAFNETPEQWV